jgi:2-C-methyl-D-erythritol 4-phosphate cytidylyltransferase/2-C-methyl-D-erythritol 2,4-cyclodiphosphate synthase
MAAYFAVNNMSSGVKAAVIIAAAGSGSRMATTEPKQFLELAGKPVLVHTALAFLQTSAISCVVLVIPESHREHVSFLITQYQLNNYSAQVKIVNGGLTRQESVANGLQALPGDIEVVLVHDGARPLVNEEIIQNCLESAAVNGAAIAAIPVKDTLKAVVDQQITGTVDRHGLWQAQTPQAARVELLKNALAVAAADGFTGTDEASILERTGCLVEVVEGSERNIKITRPEDLVLAEKLLRQDSPSPGLSVRIGHGYDVHRLVEERPLILGGVQIEHAKGLLGHSDADVLCHAICDGIVGALGLGDIGRHFPDTDPAFKGISSLKLLEHVISLAHEKGFRPANIDATVVAQQPRLAPYIGAMRRNLADCCGVGEEYINVKATTTEGLGFAGRQEGVAAHAVVLLQAG